MSQQPNIPTYQEPPLPYLMPSHPRPYQGHPLDQVAPLPFHIPQQVSPMYYPPILTQPYPFWPYGNVSCPPYGPPYSFSHPPYVGGFVPPVQFGNIAHQNTPGRHYPQTHQTSQLPPVPNNHESTVSTSLNSSNKTIPLNSSSNISASQTPNVTPNTNIAKKNEFVNTIEDAYLSDGYEYLPLEEGNTRMEVSELLRHHHCGKLSPEEKKVLAKKKKNPNYKVLSTRDRQGNTSVLVLKRKTVKGDNVRPKSVEELKASNQIDLVLSGQLSDLNELTTRVTKNLWTCVPPISIRKQIIQRYHEGPFECDHLGINKLEPLILKKYWWYGLRADLEEYSKSCEGCAMVGKTRKQHNYQRLLSFIIPKQFSHLSMDIAFIDSLDGFVGFFLVVDSLTKYAWGRKIKRKTKEVVAAELRCILSEIQNDYKCDFKQCGTRMRHDRGGEFINSAVELLLNEFHITICPTNAYSPDENGQAENTNCQLKKGVSFKIWATGDKWTNIFDGVVHNYNNTLHGVTKYSPSELIKLTSPSYLEPLQDNQEKLAAAMVQQAFVVQQVQKRIQKQGEQINRRRAKANKETGVTFRVGQVVLVRKPPYAVRTKLGIGAERVREGIILQETTGHKYYVQWRVCGGFLTGVETSYTKSKYPIDPYFFVQNHLGAGVVKGNVLDENDTYEETAEELYDADEMDEESCSETEPVIVEESSSSEEPVNSETGPRDEPPSEEEPSSPEPPCPEATSSTNSPHSEPPIDVEVIVVPKRSRVGKRKRNPAGIDSNKRVAEEPQSE